MKIFKFVTAPLDKVIEDRILAALSSERVVKAINEVVRQIILEALTDARKGFEEK